MANLSSDLNSYLSRSTSNSSLNSVTSKLSTFKLPTLDTIKSFGGGGAQQEDEEPFLGVQVVETQRVEFEYVMRILQSDFFINVQVDDGSSNSSGSPSWFGRKADEWLPSLSKKQRIIGFMTSLILGMICFGLAVSLLPMLMINPRKFSLLFSLGSAFTLSSFSFLWGPYNHLVHLLSRDRLPFTTIYLSSLILTLYFAMGLQSAILTPIAACAQVNVTLETISHFCPGGCPGMVCCFIYSWRADRSQVMPN